jgi:phosphatidylethanolamine-binding protein (PEBP) family uncharacterized protein
MVERRWCGRLHGVAAAAALVLSGCLPGPLDRRLPTAPRGIQLASPSIRAGRISEDLTCNGAGKSPGVQWRALPPATAEVAVLVVDIDGEGGERLQWDVFGIDPESTGLSTGATPPDAREGETSFGRTSYEPLCPPKGGRAHRYEIWVYALRDTTELPDGASANKVLAEIDRLAIAAGRIRGAYRNTA